jgi:hypothetical protein
MRRTHSLVLLPLVIPALVLPASPASAADVVHTGPSWSWTGPSTWDDAQGTYGITVLGERKATYDLGFSSTLCSSEATWADSVRNYFKAKRTQLRNSGLELSDVSAIKNLGGDYRRQTMSVAKGGRKGVQGVVEIDYDFTENVDGVNYCYQRSEARTAKKTAWREVKGKLAKVGNTLAYFGPGAYQDGE